MTNAKRILARDLWLSQEIWAPQGTQVEVIAQDVACFTTCGNCWETVSRHSYLLVKLPDGRQAVISTEALIDDGAAT